MTYLVEYGDYDFDQTPTVYKCDAGDCKSFREAKRRAIQSCDTIIASARKARKALQALKMADVETWEGRNFGGALAPQHTSDEE